MNFRYIYIILVILGLQINNVHSQQKSVEQEKQGIVVRARIIGYDTIIVQYLPEVNIYPSGKYMNKWDFRKYQRLIRNVRAAYPYAVLASKKLKEIEENLAQINGEKQRKQYIKLAEKNLINDFEEEVKHLTVTQGRILLKLIDRETGNTTYVILKELKGNISATFWQALARMFGSNLKSEYDPYGEDVMIEQIVVMIEEGKL